MKTQRCNRIVAFTNRQTKWASRFKNVLIRRACFCKVTKLQFCKVTITITNWTLLSLITIINRWYKGEPEKFLFVSPFVVTTFRCHGFQYQYTSSITKYGYKPNQDRKFLLSSPFHKLFLPSPSCPKHYSGFIHMFCLLLFGCCYVQNSGADALELNLSCPHGMGERGMGLACGQVCTN